MHFKKILGDSSPTFGFNKCLLLAVGKQLFFPYTDFSNSVFSQNCYFMLQSELFFFFLAELYFFPIMSANWHSDCFLESYSLHRLQSAFQVITGGSYINFFQQCKKAHKSSSLCSLFPCCPMPNIKLLTYISSFVWATLQFQNSINTLCII